MNTPLLRLEGGGFVTPANRAVTVDTPRSEPVSGPWAPMEVTREGKKRMETFPEVLARFALSLRRPSIGEEEVSVGALDEAKLTEYLKAAAEASGDQRVFEPAVVKKAMGILKAKVAHVRAPVACLHTLF